MGEDAKTSPDDRPPQRYLGLEAAIAKSLLVVSGCVLAIQLIRLVLSFTNPVSDLSHWIWIGSFIAMCIPISAIGGAQVSRRLARVPDLGLTGRITWATAVLIVSAVVANLAWLLIQNELTTKRHAFGWSYMIHNLQHQMELAVVFTLLLLAPGFLFSFFIQEWRSRALTARGDQ